MPVKIQIFTKVNPPYTTWYSLIATKYRSRLDLLYDVVTNRLIIIIRTVTKPL